jgi:PAS domain S-box-containing protein
MAADTPDQPLKATSSKWSSGKLLDRLLEPAAPIEEPRRSQVRSLSALLLILAGLNLIGSIFANASGVLIGRAAILVISYAITRTEHFRAGGLLAIAVYSVVPFISMISEGNYNHDSVMAIFIWLVLPLLLSSFIFDLRGILLLMVGYLAVIAALPIFIPELSFDQVANLIVFMGTVAGSIMLVARIREENVRKFAASEQRKKTAKEILESEEKYRNLFEHAHDAIFLIDPETLQFLDVNKNASVQFGYSREELLNMGIPDLYTQNAAAENQEIIEKLRKDGSIVVENTQLHKDGSKMLVEVSSRVVEYGNRQVIQSIVRDISERKMAEDQLRQYSDRLGALHQIEHAMISAQSPDEISKIALTRLREVVQCQLVCILYFDFEADDVQVHAADEAKDINSPFKVGKRFPFGEINIPEQLFRGSIYANNDLGEIAEKSAVEEILVSMEIYSIVNIPLYVQGEMWGSLNLAGPQRSAAFSTENVDVAKEVAGLVSVALQQSTLFREIKLGRARLQALSRRLVEAQEAERHHIANELHDEIGQALTGINLALGTHMRSLDSDREYGPLLEAQKMAEELVGRVQRMSLDLRPAMLDDLGLLPTLTWHFDRYEGQTGIKVIFDHQDIQDRFPREIETAGYRIVQEALTNVARHSNVKEVRVRANLIFIEDRGKGFSLDSALASGNASGLVGMRERALSLGGDLKIITSQGSGTQVLAELPLKDPIERRSASR